MLIASPMINLYDGVDGSMLCFKMVIFTSSLPVLKKYTCQHYMGIVSRFRPNYAMIFDCEYFAT